MPVFPKICKLLINSSMHFVKNECLTPQLTGLTTLSGFETCQRAQLLTASIKLT
jgi:hypothetical protein